MSAFEKIVMEWTEAIERSHFPDTAAASTAPGVTQAFGSLKGKVVLAQPNDGYFYLHPVLGGAVKCLFHAHLRDTVMQADKHMVEVGGCLRYREGQFLPFEIDVYQINILPMDSELPTLKSLVGIASGGDTTQSSVALVRKLRDGWH